MQQGDTAQAYQEVRDLCRKYTDDNRYRLLLANFYIQGSRNADAYHEIRQVLQRDSANDMAHALLLQYYQQQHDTAGYYAQLDTAIALGNMPGYAQVAAMSRVVRDYEQQNITSSRFYDLMYGVARQPQENSELLTSCMAYLEAKKWPEDSIIPFVRLQLVQEPTDITARFQLMKYLIGKMEVEELAEVCHEGTVHNPENYSSIIMRAWRVTVRTRWMRPSKSVSAGSTAWRRAPVTNWWLRSTPVWVTFIRPRGCAKNLSGLRQGLAV